ncbi:hypothetical protein [Gluconobacter cerinus]|uniref:Uncharacterized protein n=1 Tax=Gluconobacter cerinus TaxID=38307 RepID=A0A1B6VPN3_9PROT|nr:hypothetical protein [Gluconobacter cerinus]OAJ69018.1 hypothetical protein A0123_00588 [Gluconobacter cerinus]
MVETTTRPKCAQNSTAVVTVEDQLDDALISRPRTLADAGRDYAEAWRKYDCMNCLSEEPPEEKAARLRQEAIGAEIRSGRLPVETVEDAIVDLMCCVDTMRASIGPSGIDLVYAVPLLERLLKLTSSLGRMQGVTLSDLGGDGFCMDQDDTTDLPYYEHFLTLKALEDGLVFHVAPDGSVTIYGDVTATHPAVLQQIDDYGLKHIGTQAKALLCERDHMFLPRVGSADERLKGKHWWLSQGSVTRNNMRALEPLRVSFGPPQKDWPAVQQEMEVIKLCDHAIALEHRIAAMLAEEPSNEERIKPLDTERMKTESRARELRATTLPAQKARLRLLKERCSYSGYEKNDYATREIDLSNAILRDFIAMMGEAA